MVLSVSSEIRTDENMAEPFEEEGQLQSTPPSESIERSEPSDDFKMNEERDFVESCFPTPLITEDVASAIGCSPEEETDSLIKSTVYFPPFEHITESGFSDEGSLRSHILDEELKPFVEGPLRESPLDNTEARPSLDDDSDIQLESHLHNNQYEIRLAGLDELLLSIEIQSIERSPYATLSYTEIDTLLIAHGLSLPPHQFALHHSVIQRDLQVIYLLMRSRYRYMVNERDALGRTPFHIALLSADFAVLQLLLSMPVCPDSLQEESDDEISGGDVEFPDLSLQFSHLPSLHLPLAKAGWTAQIPNVIATYTLLLAYVELVQRVKDGMDPLCAGLHVLGTTSGWISTEVSSSTEEQGPAPLKGIAWALQRLSEFLESREETDDHLWTVNAKDGWNGTALHRASELGVAQVVEKLLDAGADPLLKDCKGDLPVHRSVDSSDPDTFTVLLRRGGASLVSSNDQLSGCDPWSEDTSMMALFRRCILRGSWRCLGRLVTDEVYSQFPIPETAVDGLLEFASLCGYSEEFSEAFKLAVDNAEPQEDGAWRRLRAGGRTDGSDLKIFSHNMCFEHLPIESEKVGLKRYKLLSRFPENPSRLYCLTPPTSGVLRTRSFEKIPWELNAPPVTLADVLRVHDWNYVRALIQRVEKVSADAELFKNTKPFFFQELDNDTPITAASWDSAKCAAGAVVAAVRSVCRGEIRQAFCAIRPPGHHVGTWGACQPSETSNWKREEEEDWANGTQGFCLLNNVAIGAAYARYNFAAMGINRIAIVDFDVHHGNGTEQIILNVKPRERKLSYEARHYLDTVVKFEITSDIWKIWLDETDEDNVFFASIHGFGDKFYPGTGGSPDNESHPNIHNIAMANGITGQQFKEEFKTKLIEPLVIFRPDLIFLSAGFDAHCHDAVNEGYGACSEFDYFWITRYIVAVANECCDGRVVSVLEGGYNTKAAALSPLAQSVVYHIKGFMQTSPGLNTTAIRIIDNTIKSTCESSSELPLSPTGLEYQEQNEISGGDGDGRVGIKRRVEFVSTEAGGKRKRRRAAIKCLETIQLKQVEQNENNIKINIDSEDAINQ